VGANKIIIKATKNFKTTQPPLEKNDKQEFFWLTGKSQNAPLCNVYVHEQPIEKTVLTHFPLPDHLCIS